MPGPSARLISRQQGLLHPDRGYRWAMPDASALSRDDILLQYLDGLPFDPYPVQEDALMTVAHSSSDGDGAGCVAGFVGGDGVLTMEEVAVDGVVQSGTVPVTS